MFRRSIPAIGSRPGTLAIPKGSPPPQIRIMQYSKEGFRELEIEDPEQIEDYLQTDRTTWIDVQGLGDEAVLRRIGKLFELHPLALESAVNIPQRARSQLFEQHQVIIGRVPWLQDGKLGLPPQICLILGRSFVLSFQERYLGLFDAVRDRVRAGAGPIWALGADYLAYALLDALIDHYFPLVEDLSHRIDDLEEEISHDPHPDALQEVQQIRRQLVIIRRVGWPQREAVSFLARDPSPFISDQVRTYFRGAYDHIAQIVDLIDALRDAASGLSELYISQVSHKTNEIMKVLTLMAGIFIPLTFIAGIYGMNFEYMPELHSEIGYFLVLGVMAGVAISMVFYFRRRGWMGPGARRKPASADERSATE